MGNLLQAECTPIELAISSQVIEFNNKISHFDGLTNIIEKDLATLDLDKMPTGWRDGDVYGELQFGLTETEKRVPMMAGSVTANVDAVCQRCLGPMKLEIQIKPKLLLLDSEKPKDDRDEFEVWELTKTEFRPHDIVEELLIMALPLSVMHNKTTDCEALSSSADGEDRQELVRPFAALRSQMT